MRKTFMHSIQTILTTAFIIVGSSAIGWAQGSNSQQQQSAKLQHRIDFGNSYIMGQSIKSGAVYLMHRKQSEINSMLQYRKDYRQEILEDFSIQDFKIQNLTADGQNPAVSQASAGSQ